MRPVSTTLGNYVLAPVERVFDLLVWQPPSLGALVRATLRPRRFPERRLDRTIQNLRTALAG